MSPTFAASARRGRASAKPFAGSSSAYFEEYSMHLFKEGKSPFLTFLNDLSPQVILLAFALFAGRNFDGSCCVWSAANIKDSAIFFLSISLWIAAAIASAIRFAETYLVSLPRIDAESRRLHNNGVSGFFKHWGALLRYTWSNERHFFWESLVVFTIIEMGLVIVLVLSVFSAVQFSELLHA